MSDFEPIGELARWRVLVDEFANVDRGTVITYEELGKVLGLDPANEADKRAIRSAVYHATRALSKDHDRSLVAVRGVGYRVVLPGEHVELAGRQQRKSTRALVRAKTHVDHVDLSELSDEGKRIVHATASALAWQQGQMRRMDIRQRDLEKVVASVVTKQDRTEEEVSQLRSDLQAQIDALKAENA